MKIDIIQVIGMIIFIAFSFFWIGHDYHKNKTNNTKKTKNSFKSKIRRYIRNSCNSRKSYFEK